MKAQLEPPFAASSLVDIEVPFDLEVREEGLPPGLAEAQQVLHCEQILRHLPGRRLVVRTRWAGRPAVLKLFIGAGAVSYRDRESVGLEALRVAGARVPERLALVQQATGVGIVTAYLADAQNLDVANTTQVDALVRLFAHLHARGISHTDPHLGNFLTAAGELHVVDGDGIRTGSRALSPQDSLGNLGELLAQFPPVADGWMTALIRTYLDARAWSATEYTAPAQVALAAARRDRYRRYLKKTRRTCSEFEVEKAPASLRIRVRAEDVQIPGTFFTAPDDLLNRGGLLKAGNSATVARCAVAPGAATGLVIKRYNVKSWGQALRRSLSPLPRFRRAWSYGALLRLLEIPTARPLALLEQGMGPWRPRAWLLLEDLGDRDLGVELQEALGSGAEDRIAARVGEVVGLFAALRAARLVHGDTKASNFLIHRDRVHLIDLDAMTLAAGAIRGTDQDAHIAGSARDIARFLENWEPGLRARFEAAFRAAGLL
ncbi:MAG: lipopolysaccharide kinase InaA family protein [Pseudomonadales bacterium]|nr:phosphotransferase [Pseudomonadales bacterium]